MRRIITELLTVMFLLVGCYAADPTQTCAKGKQADYRGTKSTTVAGLECQAWTSQSPHSHSYTPEKYPNAGLEANYCRNPDGTEPAAWCYTTSSKRWDYCGIPSCETDPTQTCAEGKQADYRGTKNTTVDGLECQAWTSQSPHSHSRTPEKYPNAGLYANFNYCRNPDDEASAWCYTTSSKRWDYCGIPSCEEVREIYDFGEMNGARISMNVDGVDLNMAVREDLDSFLCHFVYATCQLVYTDDTTQDTLWNIIPYKLLNRTQCYKMEKAGGYAAGKAMSPSSRTWADNEPALQTLAQRNPGEDTCWELVPVGEDTYKIKKRLGDQHGKMVTAPPVESKETDVPRTRRFVRISDEDTDNVWQIKTANTA